MSDETLTRLRASLGDRYRIERELGGGGMSRVFLATETALGREIVIKVLAPELMATVGVERFAREVQLAARLQHANIVPVLTAGDAPDVAYYTMPYVRGETLRARMARERASVDDAIGILRDVARALAYAHGDGVVHRDIKPDNILLSGGAAVVTDFGIAKAISASRTLDGQPPRSDEATLTQVGSSIGTPAYMAPEQAVGERVDHRADLYAWGVVAYELLAAQHPFAGKSGTAQLIAAHIAETPTSLTVRAPGVPRDIAALVMQCLEKDPAQRPENATALLTRLSNTVTPAADVSAPPTRTSRTRWLSLAVPLVAVLALLGWAAMHRQAGATVTRTVVVIPFDNLGAAEDLYFADGVTDEIAGRLARIPGLQVVARASVLRYRGSNKSPQDIARELGAEYALSGSVRWARIAGASGRGANDSTLVRIVPALIRVSTGAQLWGEPLQQRLTDVFKVQADVAERVASALSLTLGAADLAAVRRSESLNADARDAQLLGRFLLKQRGGANLQRAAVEFGRAIALDSSYARAWSGYAEALSYLPQYGANMSVAQSIEQSGYAARRSIALDSLSSEAHLALATVYEHAQRFNEGLQAIERAVALDPGNAFAWKEQGVLLLALGRVPEAEAPLRRALALDPLVPVAHMELAIWYAAVGFSDSASMAFTRMIALDTGSVIFRVYAEIASGSSGRYGDARDACVAAGKSAVGCARLWGSATTGRDARIARAVLDTMTTVLPTATQIPASVQAVQYALLGVVDSAFARLRSAVRAKDPTTYSVVNLPALALLRGDPRWAALMLEYRGR